MDEGEKYTFYINFSRNICRMAGKFYREKIFLESEAGWGGV